MTLTLRINGNEHAIDVDDDTSLLWVIRDVLCMTGTSSDAEIAYCGACTVHLDDHRCETHATGQRLTLREVLSEIFPHPGGFPLCP
jgi:aerobic-type carbon monoxide dehydrogenase small subunit (CoxS/CutS family)